MSPNSNVWNTENSGWKLIFMSEVSLLWRLIFSMYLYVGCGPQIASKTKKKGFDFGYPLISLASHLDSTWGWTPKDTSCWSWVYLNMNFWFIHRGRPPFLSLKSVASTLMFKSPLSGPIHMVYPIIVNKTNTIQYLVKSHVNPTFSVLNKI